jgi:hypothetical protein
MLDCVYMFAAVRSAGGGGQGLAFGVDEDEDRGESPGRSRSGLIDESGTLEARMRP